MRFKIRIQNPLSKTARGPQKWYPRLPLFFLFPEACRYTWLGAAACCKSLILTPSLFPFALSSLMLSFAILSFAIWGLCSFAATVDQWRSRSIYQLAWSCFSSHHSLTRSRIITDRFALPQAADKTQCDPGQQTWCGGTWNT